MDERKLPPGLVYIPNFVDKELEKVLVHEIDSRKWDTTLARRTQHYGYKYRYDKNSKDLEAVPYPNFAKAISGYVFDETNVFDITPDQVIVNEYFPGQGISKHIDHTKFFGHAVASLSLLSGCNMIFSHKEHEPVSVWLEPRSLVILTGDVRYKWQHEIKANKTDTVNGKRIPRDRRISITFREKL